MTSDRALKRVYREVNRLYFGGELSDDLPVWWEPCGSNAAETVKLADDPLELGIKIDPFIFQSSRLVKLHMIHESAHVKLWPIKGLADHGARFDQEIQRLCSFRSYRKLL